jgi:hypothetical protein
MKSENRLVKKFSGNNTDISMNFIPKMEYEKLMKGYKQILNTIYSPRVYYERVAIFLREYRPVARHKGSIPMEQIRAFIRSIWIMGIKQKGRRYYWKLLVWTLVKRPRLFPLSITLAIYGFHFRQVANNIARFPIRDTA